MAKSSQKGLGKGLGALFAEPVVTEERQKEHNVLPIQKLEPNRAQPRQDFDEEPWVHWQLPLPRPWTDSAHCGAPLSNGYYQIIAGNGGGVHPGWRD